MTRSRPRRRAAGRTVGLTYRTADGSLRTCRPEEAADVAFEACLPIRSFTNVRTQKHTPGLFWSATMRAHLAYESRLECDWLLEADFDPRVVGISTQPFRIDFPDPRGGRSHIPDIFHRNGDLTAHLRDAKDPRAVDDADVVEQRERTRALCEEIGWTYDMVTAPDPVRKANLGWLSAYRRPATIDPDLASQILTTVEVPSTVGEITRATGRPEATLPLLFHLAWKQAVVFDLHERMTARTLFRRAAEGGA